MERVDEHLAVCEQCRSGEVEPCEVGMALYAEQEATEATPLIPALPTAIIRPSPHDRLIAWPGALGRRPPE